MPSTSHLKQQIIFIDAAVEGIPSIIASVDPSIQVVVLDGNRDGVTQIAEALNGRTGLDAVHVISHGGPGHLQLGDGAIDLQGLDARADALALIGDSLSEQGDLLLYGCDVAAGEAGKAFIDALSAATGADVAASVDTTGPAQLGGDGSLEARTGPIEADVLELIGIEHVLASPSNDGFESNLTGWTPSDAVIGTGGVYAAGSNNWTVNPYGSKMAVVQPAGASGERAATYTALGVGSTAQTYLDSRFSNPTNYGHVYTTVTLAAGEEFSMAWNYVATDYSPYNDASIATLVNTSNPNDLSMQIRPGAGSNFTGGQVSILGATVAGTGNYVTGNYGSTGWQVVSFKAGEAGVYKLGFAVFNLADTIYSPYLFIDQAPGSTLKNGTNFGPVPAPTVVPPPPVTNSSPVFSATTHTNGNTLTDTAADDTFPVLTGKVNATDSNNDTLTYTVSNPSSGNNVKVGAYGTFALNTATGTFTYTPNDAAVEGLKTSTTESFTVLVSDGKGGSATSTVTFTIAGTNDATVFGGTSAGSVVEDGTLTATGTITASDTDTGDAALTAAAATSAYGTFIVNAAGQWTYTLNNGTAAVQSLQAGQVVNDAFQVATAGGSTQPVTITITGRNDRPTLSANASLLTQVEDTVDNSATTVATLLGGRFADADAGASFAGVLISGNTATSAQGTWQYRIDGDSPWQSIPASGLSGTNALALSAGTQIRFAPAQDYNGTPGALTVHAADEVYSGGFTGASAVFAAVSGEGVATSGRSIAIVITPVNDAPVFGGSNLAVSLSDTAAPDSVTSVAATASVPLAGTLVSTDADGGALSYGLLGAQQGTGSESALRILQGTYGRLTLNPQSGAWVYAPNQTTAIDALEAGETGIEAFTFTVTDATGAGASKTLTVSIAGSNDAPVLASALADATVFGGAWTYQLPVQSFTDGEGRGLSYTVALLDGSGELLNGGALPAGMTFDSATRTLTGTSPLAYDGASYQLRVTASDGTASVSDVLALTVANRAPESSADSVTLSEGQTRVLSLSDFGNYADADGDALAAVRITGLPDDGALEFYVGSIWVAVDAGQEITAADIAAGHLRFVPEAGRIRPPMQRCSSRCRTAPPGAPPATP